MTTCLLLIAAACYCWLVFVAWRGYRRNRARIKVLEATRLRYARGVTVTARYPDGSMKTLRAED